MNRTDLLAFIRRHKLAVFATTSAAGAPEEAVVGFAVNDALELVFDTLRGTRKMRHLRDNPSAGHRLGRSSDFTRDPPRVVEFGAAELGG